MDGVLLASEDSSFSEYSFSLNIEMVGGVYSHPRGIIFTC